MGARTSMRMCRPAFLRMRPVLLEGAAPPGHNRDPSPRWAGTRHSRALPMAGMLLARSGVYHWDLATWCQQVPTTASRGHGSVPARPPWAGPGDLWKMPRGARGHAALVLCRCRRTSLGISGSCSASPQHRGHRRPPPRAGEPGTYAAFSRHGNNTCSAPCSAPGRREGSPPPPCPPRSPHQPPAPSGAQPLPPGCGHPRVAGAPGPHGTAQPLPDAVRAERAKSSFPSPAVCQDPARRRHPLSAPAIGSRRTRERCRGRGGASWIFMSREFADQKAQSCFPL